VGALCDALIARNGDTIIVSDEVGLSVHPETRIGREFRDALGTLNQSIAAVCDDVLFVVAGRVISLTKDGDQ
jgi:nicotinate-nucleotide--dimethylbenzimidazole phosphoribosyltransferase